MSDFQNNKQFVLDFYEALDKAPIDRITEILSRFTTDDYFWRGMHPFYEQKGAENVSKVFWQPFRESFTSIQRRPDIFMAGLNKIDGFQSEWVCSMGHLMGLFDKQWLGIPPTYKMGFLRYVEFHQIVSGKIVQTALFCDIVGIMQQAGLHPFPEQTGATIVTPGPRTHDGLLFTKQDEKESEKTLSLITRMINDLRSGNTLHSDREELLKTWHDDMLWFGPAGIGATYTTERYELQHQSPFKNYLDNIRPNEHLCRFAEGNYGGFFGWPNLFMKPKGGFMGMPASGETEMRIVDIYRRDGDKLAENWIFIDLLHFYYKLGLNVLERMQSLRSINKVQLYGV